MAKKPPRRPDKTEMDKRRVDRWDKEDADGVDGFDRYCPTCKTYYPPTQDGSHAGH